MTNIRLSDGRILEVLDNGIDADQALILHHGTPSDATLWASWLEYCAGRGLRAISSSRPGYGNSSRQRGRKVASAAEDIAQLLDLGNIKSFVALGWSGGGPHALATATDHRCKGAVTIAGVGAYGQQDLDFLTGMGPENLEEFGAAVQGEAPLEAWMQSNALGLKDVTGPQLRDAFGGLVGDVDRAVLEGAFAEDLAATLRHALSNGFYGWLDDDLAFTSPWGFSFASITCPVEIWQGDEDFMVPHVHADWLHGRLPSSRLNFVAGQGHVSLVSGYRDDILKQVMTLLS